MGAVARTALLPRENEDTANTSGQRHEVRAKGLSCCTYCLKCHCPFVTYTQAYNYYLDVLRTNPQLPAPRRTVDTFEAIHTWKSEMRAFDAAQIKLGIVTAQDVQHRNAAVRVTGPYRIIHHARYDR